MSMNSDIFYNHHINDLPEGRRLIEGAKCVQVIKKVIKEPIVAYTIFVFEYQGRCLVLKSRKVNGFVVGGVYDFACTIDMYVNSDWFPPADVNKYIIKHPRDIRHVNCLEVS